MGNHQKIEWQLLRLLEDDAQTVHPKKLNEAIEAEGIKNVTLSKLKTIFNYWAIKNWIRRSSVSYINHDFKLIFVESKTLLETKLKNREKIAYFIIDYLFLKVKFDRNSTSSEQELLVHFSVLELKNAFQEESGLFQLSASLEDIEDALFYLSKIEALKIEGGFLVLYNRMTINRLETDNRKSYKVEDYQKLGQFYESKIQQIHIVGEYALKMIENYESALRFVDDYFGMDYADFLHKYFSKKRLDEIRRTITSAKFNQLFGTLSENQLAIVKDQEQAHMVVLAGPGSGKTRVLVHKLASLLLLEDVKHEQLLMLTFSRAAANEFKLRLRELIGNAQRYIDVKTFHSFCFDLSGRVGTLKESDNIIGETVRKIRDGKIEKNYITKTVLVIDEAQDMNEDEFELVLALMEANEGMRVIAVGDDDQAIYGFRHASADYLKRFIDEKGANRVELIRNYRSDENLVQFSNQFLTSINGRLKSNQIEAVQKKDGIIRIHKYSHEKFVEVLTDDLANRNSQGTTAVLTFTNEEAFLANAFLLKRGFSSKLIQNTENFRLSDMDEIRFLMDILENKLSTTTISTQQWSLIKQDVFAKFGKSRNYEIIKNLMRTFEEIYSNSMYKSDLEALIREGAIEDFYEMSAKTIRVSTLHKAKGTEFDNVHILLSDFGQYLGNDEHKRLLYVGFTRAKSELNIHLRGNFLDHLRVNGLERFYNSEVHPISNELVLTLTHKDIYLDKFIGMNAKVEKYVAGDKLIVAHQRLVDEHGHQLIVFSNAFNSQVQELNEKGYHLTEAIVNFVLHWHKKDSSIETRVILPEVRFTS